MHKEWNVYLAGEIHSDWRAEVQSAVDDLPIVFTEPVTDHKASDDCGVDLLGDEDKAFWKDRKSARINAIRTRTYIEEADVVVVRFGDKYRQWNAAFDAGYAAALGKALITLHDEDLDHALKEVDAAAHAVCRNARQVAGVLHYVIAGA
jgi:YtoQ family protein